MKKQDVQVGGTYTAKVGQRVVHVKIENEHRLGGWDATNLATGKRIRIKTAQRLRGTVQAAKSQTEGYMDVIRGSKPTQATRGARRPKPVPVAEPVVTAELAPGFARAVEAATEQPTTRRPSLLTAAAQVLASTGRPMGAREIVEAVAAAGLWSSPAGKTPHLTLSSAIIREIAQKGDDSRFRKVDRGQFEASGQ